MLSRQYERKRPGTVEQWREGVLRAGLRELFERGSLRVLDRGGEVHDLQADAVRDAVLLFPGNLWRTVLLAVDTFFSQTMRGAEHC